MRKVFVNWCIDDVEVDLPSIVKIPDDLSDEDVADWLSDEYGFLVESWYYEY